MSQDGGEQAGPVSVSQGSCQRPSESVLPYSMGHLVLVKLMSSGREEKSPLTEERSWERCCRLDLLMRPETDEGEKASRWCWRSGFQILLNAECMIDPRWLLHFTEGELGWISILAFLSIVKHPHWFAFNSFEECACYGSWNLGWAHKDKTLTSRRPLSSGSQITCLIWSFKNPGRISS